MCALEVATPAIRRVPIRTDATLPTSPISVARLEVFDEHLTMLMLCAELASPLMLLVSVQTTELLSLLALMTLVIWNLALDALTTLSEMRLPRARRVLAELDEARLLDALLALDRVALLALLALGRSVRFEDVVPLDVWQLTATSLLIPKFTVLVMLWLISIPFVDG